MVCIFQITGKKDSGKTLAIEMAVKKLKSEGFIVGVVKHSHHIIDSENKDTFRVKRAGADIVIFHSNNCALFFDCDDYLSLMPVDVILVEGFKGLELGIKLEIENPNQAPEIAEKIDKMVSECKERVEGRLYIDGKDNSEHNLLSLFIIRLMKKKNIREIKLVD
ncbi:MULTISPECIES: molybdopterin-guanine dinucleotide biosynthesis protein B [Acidianus]|uniref:Molybdopterin-guanine dinucleotide biosynthesis protein MobB n=1 Tax=Candidatus Acidianus copahuensis TaxID=1160895 RepID=A0A031LM39_9CREN|nr:MULTISPECIES: molybdopterin-guanine dinucleotide biosynthesis protein B [Acidianus]EZQ03211.1 molybdopterin-guanine dinucleotide biosynthesis protein MobB [Candidatus Acidianus copahuensis]NON63616.1 molybdopterin-guanine dinucleotide biosynthesis protein B [Acidianus sp. RZ1]